MQVPGLRMGGNLLLLWVLSAILALHAATPAQAYGAFAEARSGVGFAWGAVANKTSEAAAREDAVAGCNEAKEGLNWSGTCRVTETFEGQCLAVANDRGEGAVGTGHDAKALGEDKASAEAKAIKGCKAKGGGSACRALSVCDSVEAPRRSEPEARPGPSSERRPNEKPATPTRADPTPSAVPQPSVSQVSSRDLDKLREEAEFANNIAIAIAVGAAVIIGLTIAWANSRISTLQHALRRVQGGVTGLFTQTRQGGPNGGFKQARQSGATVFERQGQDGVSIPHQSLYGTIKLLPAKGGDATLMLDTDKMSRAGLSLGRDPSSDVTIDHPSVSGRHARVWQDSSGKLMIEDVGSTNGTYRNGQKILRASLKVGDMIRLGQAEYKVTS